MAKLIDSYIGCNENICDGWYIAKPVNDMAGHKSLRERICDAIMVLRCEATAIQFMSDRTKPVVVSVKGDG